MDLLRVKADLGRMGGLLQLWLSDPVKSADYTQEIKKVLHQIEANQKILQPLVYILEEAVRKRK